MILSGFTSRIGRNLLRIQKMCFLFVKWFHWILNEFISHIERDLMRRQEMILIEFTSCIKRDLMGIQEICALFVK